MRYPIKMCFLVTTAAILCCGCQSTRWAPYDLGPYERATWTASEAAHLPLNQGLKWYYSFESDLAKRAFAEAGRLDESSPMPWWGISIASGPTINNPEMTEEQSEAAWDALKSAESRLSSVTPVERALISALGKRYAWPAPEDRSGLDAAYAAAMGEMHRAFPEDPDVATLYAESLMILRPWKQWTRTGEPEPGTEEALAALEAALALDPDCLGAHHFTIHAVEGSRKPEIGLGSAERLKTLAPDAAHLLHMPSHIFMRMGQWEKAVLPNEQANKALIRLQISRPEMGNFDWALHHLDVLILIDMMTGDREGAIRHARALDVKQPLEDALEDIEGYDPYMLPLPSVYKRFGMWDEILACEPLPPQFTVSNANLHHLRAVAFAAKGDVQSARTERDLLVDSLSAVPEDIKWGSANKAINVLRIAVPYVDGEIAYREGNIEEAIIKLTEAVEIEDQLTYDEPPVWTTPTRHALGAVLLEAGRAEEAEAVYRADLIRYPENGWSLWGLTRALELQGKEEEAQAAQARQEQAWTSADFPLTTSCQCVKGEPASGG